MKKISITGLCLLVAAMVALLTGARLAEAVICSPSQLTPCAGAISYSTKPSAACCSVLKQQQPCLCRYINDPSLKPYVNSPGAKLVLSSCRVPFPRCS